MATLLQPNPTIPTYSYERSAAVNALTALRQRHYIVLMDNRSLRQLLLQGMDSPLPEHVVANTMSLIADFVPDGALDEPLSGFERHDLEARLGEAARHAEQILERARP